MLSSARTKQAGGCGLSRAAWVFPGLFGQTRAVRSLNGWLSDNGGCYTARDSRASKRDYVHVDPRPDAQILIEQLPGCLAYYNEGRPHRALGYC